jgi:hypothetical protein
MNKEHDDGAQGGIAERGESDPIAHHVFPPWSPPAKYHLLLRSNNGDQWAPSRHKLGDPAL